MLQSPVFGFGGEGGKCRISEGTETGLPLCSNGETGNTLWQGVTREILGFILHRNSFQKEQTLQKAQYLN